MSHSKQMCCESLWKEDIFEATTEQKFSVQHTKKYCGGYQKLLKSKGSSDVPEVSVKFGSEKITFKPTHLFHVQNSVAVKTANQELWSVLHNMVDATDPESVRAWNEFIESIKAIVLNEYQLAINDKQRVEAELVHTRLVAQTNRAELNRALYYPNPAELPSGLSVSHPALSQPVVPPMRAGDVPISEEVKTSFFNKV